MSGLLQDWVSEQAGRRPDAPAMVFRDERMTYGALELASNQLAELLHAVGCRRGDRVCLLMPKSPMAIVAILGVLKADAIYVPLDPEAPVARLERMIAACDDRWILASGAVGPALRALQAIPRLSRSTAVGWLGARPISDGVRHEFVRNDLATRAGKCPPARNTPNDAAHILFTSGSTGMPKGVVVTHAAVRQFVEWAVPYFGITETDHTSGHPPLHFDLSTFDIFGSFAAGAALHLVSPDLNLLPHKLAGFIRNEALTQWFSVPSVLNYMAKFDAVRSGDFPALRRVLWCGEVLPTASLRHWMQRLPHVTFTNLYGPTEATIASSYYTVPACPADDDDAIPIGRPCPGEGLVVLDELLRPAPVGEVGELHIRGGGLSPGYWRDPERTRAVFVPDPEATEPGGRLYRTGDLASVGPDGLFRYVGRTDSQIKARGYRVELGEVEGAMNALGTLHECAVIGAPSGGFDGTAICAAYVPLRGQRVTVNDLREGLRRTLPHYMLPSRWQAFDALPKTSNGKIDRRRLKELFASAAGAAVT